MVMEASPSPQSVGREFVRQYYTLLNKAPAHLHRFYNNFSSFVHGGLDAPNRETLPVVGQKQIHNRIQQLNFRDCHAKISQVDAQATLGSGVVVQVTGELSNDGAPMRRFTQTFVLAAQSPKKYYVHNDIFRYQDIVFSDEEGENSGRSEGEEEGAVGGYFPGGGFPAPPAPPALQSPPAGVADAPHVNGLAQLHEEGARHATSLGAPLEADVSELSSEEHSPPPGPAPVPGPGPAPALEPELEPEPEPEPEPQPPMQPLVQVPPEPKTYANLLKSGGGGGVRVSPPAPPAPAPLPPPPAPPAPPLDQRPRHVRVPPPAGGETRSGRAAAAAAAGAGAGAGPRYSDAQQLFLGNVPHAATEEQLRALFARFGPVAELRLHCKPPAPAQPRPPNYGFVTYESAAHAHRCLAAPPLYYAPDSTEGVKLNVEEKKARGRDPPRRRPLSPPHRGAAPASSRPAFRR